MRQHIEHGKGGSYNWQLKWYRTRNISYASKEPVYNLRYYERFECR